MKVMKDHDWFDEDIQSVEPPTPLIGVCEKYRTLIISDGNGSGLVSFLHIHKNDVIALAKEFGLMVFEEGSEL